MFDKTKLELESIYTNLKTSLIKDYACDGADNYISDVALSLLEDKVKENVKLRLRDLKPDALLYVAEKAFSASTLERLQNEAPKPNRKARRAKAKRVKKQK